MKNIFKIFISALLLSLTMTGCAQSDSDEKNISGQKEDNTTIVLTNLLIESQGDIVEIGKTEKATAIARFSDGSTEDITTKAEWSSSDINIATVSNDGTVTGIAEGNVSITGSFTDEYSNNVSDTIKMTVYAVEPAFVTAEIKGVDYLTATYKTQLDVYVTISDGTSHHANDRANWSSSDTKIATVDADGVVVGISEGNVTITATAKADNTKTANHKMLIGKIPTGTIVRNNIIWDFDDKLVIDRNDTHVTGLTGKNEGYDPRYGVWYFHEVGYGFEKDQTVGETYFTFSATKDNVLNAVTIDVYLNNGSIGGNKKAKIDPSLSDSQEENLRYPTWADLRAAHPDWIVRSNYSEKGEKRLLHGNFFLRLGNSGYEEKESFEISKYIVIKVPEAGLIVKDNVLWAESIVLSADGKKASGKADGRAVWYFNEIGNGFIENQKVSETNFEFTATGGNGVFVNVYITDGTALGQETLRIGIDDVATNGYLTWADVPTKFDDYTLRNYWQTTSPGKRVRGNFFLRIGDSGYAGNDPYTIDKFIVLRK